MRVERYVNKFLGYFQRLGKGIDTLDFKSIIVTYIVFITYIRTVPAFTVIHDVTTPNNRIPSVGPFLHDIIEVLPSNFQQTKHLSVGSRFCVRCLDNYM